MFLQKHRWNFGIFLSLISIILETIFFISQEEQTRLQIISVFTSLMSGNLSRGYKLIIVVVNVVWLVVISDIIARIVTEIVLVADHIHRLVNL